MEHKCPECGKVFDGKASREFCSRACANRAKARQPEYLKKVQEHRRAYFKSEAGRAHASMHSIRMKTNNPMNDPALLEKAKQSRLNRGVSQEILKHRWPGTGFTVPQMMLYQALGKGWELEYVILTHVKKGNGIATAYKVDLGNSRGKWAIELDGAYHNAPKQRALDSKKDSVLASLGWQVIRIRNAEVLLNIDGVLKQIQTRMEG